MNFDMMPIITCTKSNFFFNHASCIANVLPLFIWTTTGFLILSCLWGHALNLKQPFTESCNNSYQFQNRYFLNFNLTYTRGPPIWLRSNSGRYQLRCALRTVSNESSPQTKQMCRFGPRRSSWKANVDEKYCCRGNMKYADNANVCRQC